MTCCYVLHQAEMARLARGRLIWLGLAPCACLRHAAPRTGGMPTTNQNRHHDDDTPATVATTVAKQKYFITTTGWPVYNLLVWIRALILGTDLNQHVEIGHQ